jgi:uncharacterized membrane protein
MDFFSLSLILKIIANVLIIYAVIVLGYTYYKKHHKRNKGGKR